MPSSQSKWVIRAAASLGTFAASSVAAQVSGSWVGPSTGTWEHASNWTSNPNFPDAGGEAYLDPGRAGSLSVNSSGSFNVSRLVLGGYGSSRVTVPLIVSPSLELHVPFKAPHVAPVGTLFEERFAGTLHGAGEITKTGDGSVLFTAAGADTFTGTLRIAQGGVRPSGWGPNTHVILDGGLVHPFSPLPSIAVTPNGGTLNYSAGFGTTNFTGGGQLNLISDETTQRIATTPCNHIGPVILRDGRLSLQTSSQTGAFPSTSRLDVRAGLELNSNSDDQINNTAEIVLRGGDIAQRIPSPIRVETIGAITVADAAGRLIGNFSAQSLTRQGRGVLQVSTLSLAVAPAMIGSGTFGTPQVPIIPFCASHGNLASSLIINKPLTVENGIVRMLTTAELVSTLPHRGGGVNFLAQNSTIDEPITVNSVTGTILGTGTVTITSGALFIGEGSNGFRAFSAPIQFGGIEGILHGDFASGGHFTGPISGNNGLTISGSHAFSGVSEYTGTTTIFGRAAVRRDVQSNVPGPFGADSIPIQLFAGRYYFQTASSPHGQLSLAGDNGQPLTFGRDIHVRSNESAAYATIATTASTPGAPVVPGLVTGNIQLDANIALLGASNTATLTVSGNVSGSGGIVQARNLVLSGKNTFSGGVMINDGTVQIGSDTAFGTGIVQFRQNSGTVALPSLIASNGPRSLANPVFIAAAVFRGEDMTFTGPLLTGLGSSPSASLFPIANTVTFAGPIRIRGALVVEGTGTACLSGFQANTVSVNRGVLKLLEDGGGYGASQFGLNVGTLGTFDLTNNTLFTGTDSATLRAVLSSGHAGGAWTGRGVTSSTAAATTVTGIGYAQVSEVFNASQIMIDGLFVAGTSNMLRYTLYGDANLDYTVDIGDFANLAASFNLTNSTWSRGDFNYDAVTNITDFALLAANFNQSLPADLPRQSIPEPAALAGATFVIILLQKRNRKC